jgi:hypothetical protein
MFASYALNAHGALPPLDGAALMASLLSRLRRQSRYAWAVALQGKVIGGKIVLDEDVRLPEGATVKIALVDDGDELDDEEREDLYRSIARGLEQARRGEVHSAEDIFRELRTLR